MKNTARKSTVSVVLGVGFALAAATAAWAYPNYASWNGSTGSESWTSHYVCSNELYGGASGAPSIAYGQTLSYSGACDARVYLNGDLYGTDWFDDTGWVASNAYTQYWGTCDYNIHKSKKNSTGVVWNRSRNC